MKRTFCYGFIVFMLVAVAYRPIVKASVDKHGLMTVTVAMEQASGNIIIQSASVKAYRGTDPDTAFYEYTVLETCDHDVPIDLVVPDNTVVTETFWVTATITGVDPDGNPKAFICKSNIVTEVIQGDITEPLKPPVACSVRWID